ncbi:MAG: hypothetical protein ACXVEF_15735 [Polyangiales bacterium]
MFDDVDHDDLEADAEASDRVLFSVIEAKGEIGDLPVFEAWGILADRYSDDRRLHILALAHDVEENGQDAVRDREAIERALEAIGNGLDPSLRDAHGALSVVIEDALGKASDESYRKARRTIRKLEQALLEEADKKTKGDKPFGVRAAPKPAVDDATLIAKAQGPMKKYAPTETFAVGDRVDHSKFGLGVVLAREENKVEVAFESGRKRLVCA